MPKKLKALTELPAESMVLRRGQLVFGEWSLKLCKQLLAYVDPEVSIVGLARLNLQGAYQLMEYCLDIRCFGDRKDRAATTNMRELWVNLNKVDAWIQVKDKGCKILKDPSPQVCSAVGMG